MASIVGLGDFVFRWRTRNEVVGFGAERDRRRRCFYRRGPGPGAGRRRVETSLDPAGGWPVSCVWSIASDPGKCRLWFWLYGCLCLTLLMVLFSFQLAECVPRVFF
jgi:hypothetical protein